MQDYIFLTNSASIKLKIIAKQRKILFERQKFLYKPNRSSDFMPGSYICMSDCNRFGKGITAYAECLCGLMNAARNCT